MRVHEGLDRRGARFRVENGELAEDVVLDGLGSELGNRSAELLVSSSIIGPDFNGDGVVASFTLLQ